MKARRKYYRKKFRLIWGRWTLRADRGSCRRKSLQRKRMGMERTMIHSCEMLTRGCWKTPSGYYHSFSTVLSWWINPNTNANAINSVIIIINCPYIQPLISFSIFWGKKMKMLLNVFWCLGWFLSGLVRVWILWKVRERKRRADAIKPACLSCFLRGFLSLGENGAWQLL